MAHPTSEDANNLVLVPTPPAEVREYEILYTPPVAKVAHHTEEVVAEPPPTGMMASLMPGLIKSVLSMAGLDIKQLAGSIPQQVASFFERMLEQSQDEKQPAALMLIGNEIRLVRYLDAKDTKDGERVIIVDTLVPMDKVLANMGIKTEKEMKTANIAELLESIINNTVENI